MFTKIFSVISTTSLILLVAACSGGGGGSTPAAAGGTTKYTIGGTVSGLTGTGLVLQNNLSDNLIVSTNGAGTFAISLTNGAAYSVSVFSQPSGQTCTVANGSGTVSGANITTVAVTCSNGSSYTIGGTVSGLTGTGLVIQNNGGDNLKVTTNGAGYFPTWLATGSSYYVTVLTQPSGQSCSVSNGIGTVGTSNVTNVNVTCSSATSTLACGSGNGTGYQGIYLYNPSNLFTESLSTTTGGALDSVTLGWGAEYLGSAQGAYTGSLVATLWAVTSSYSGTTGINGTVLGTFYPNFTGTGAYSASQIATGGYSTNTIVSSTASYNPAAGQYCLVITLEEYLPSQCPTNPGNYLNGYCTVDWLQFSSPVSFH